LKQENIKTPPYLNASYEGDDLYTGDQLRAAVLAEREACAKVCEAQEDKGGEWDVQQQCANAIRARGQ